MATSAGCRVKESHVLNFFYDKDDGSALTVLVNGVRFHAYVDFEKLKESAKDDTRAVEEYSRLLKALKDSEQAEQNQEQSDDKSRHQSSDPDSGYEEAEERTPESEGEEIYCLCRKPEKGFMIGCDSCDEWFHGECVDVKEEDKDAIDEYVCPRCSDKDNKRKTKAASQDSGIVLEDDKTSPEEELQQWILHYLSDEVDKHAPSRREKKDSTTVQDWYNPPTKFYSLEFNSTGTLYPVELEENSELTTRMQNLTPVLQMPKYILNLPLPHISPSDLLVQEESASPSPVHPTTVLYNSTPAFLKVVDPTQPGPTKREIKMLNDIKKAGLHKKFLVPEVLGLVTSISSPTSKHPSNTTILGFLQTPIPSATPLTHLLDSSIPHPKRHHWAQECDRIVALLHENGFVWGDAKADNFMVDDRERLWIIDFGGSYTEGWVEERLNETVEGDEMGVGKVVGALEDPDENTFDEEDEREEGKGVKRKAEEVDEDDRDEKRAKAE